MTGRTKTTTSADRVWALLINLSPNWGLDILTEAEKRAGGASRMRLSERLWDDLVRQAAQNGINTLVIDVLDAVRYASHPELALRDAWPVKTCKSKLREMRAAGLVPIPKLNFATKHSFWLKQYRRCISTPAYYQLCRDLIAETIEIFDGPPYFHLGMDEEVAPHMFNKYYDLLVTRQNELWWHDLNFLIAEVKKGGAQAWIWADMLWRLSERNQGWLGSEEEARRQWRQHVPRDVIHSNWYYGAVWDLNDPRQTADADFIRYFGRRKLETYCNLDRMGYPQIPCGSSNNSKPGAPDIFLRLTQYAAKTIRPRNLLGFIQSVWACPREPYRPKYLRAIARVKAARTAFEAGDGKGPTKHVRRRCDDE